MQRQAPQGPCFILGDLNIDAFEAGGQLLADLKKNLSDAADAWEASPIHRAVAFWPDGKLLTLPSPQLPTDPQPLADTGKTKGGPRCFEKGDTFVEWHDPERMRNGSRIDYVLAWPGPAADEGARIEFAQGRVVMQHLLDGRDASDHYGLQFGLRSIRLRRPRVGP